MNRRFADCVKSILTNKIKGNVRYWLEDDRITFTIFCENGIKFSYKCYNISSEIVQGYSSETCAYEIVKRYRHFINNLYFK